MIGEKFKHFHGFLTPKKWFHLDRFVEKVIDFGYEQEPLVFQCFGCFRNGFSGDDLVLDAFGQ
jgi:hypothetical protein